MASTNIDGTPILILGALEVVPLLGVLEDAEYLTDCYGNDTSIASLVAKIKRFLEDPDVIKWLEAHS